MPGEKESWEWVPMCFGSQEPGAKSASFLAWEAGLENMIMSNDFVKAIKALVSAYPDISPKRKQAILSACGNNPERRKLIKRKEVLEILGVSAPTLRGYIKSGLIREICLSARKRRFDFEEIVLFANAGVPWKTDVKAEGKPW